MAIFLHGRNADGICSELASQEQQMATSNEILGLNSHDWPKTSLRPAYTFKKLNSFDEQKMLAP